MKLLALSLMSSLLCAQQVAPSTPRTVVSDTMKDLSGQVLAGDITLTLNDPQYTFVRKVPAVAGIFSTSLYPGTYSVVIHSSTFGLDRSEAWVVPNSGSVQTLSDVGSPSANITGGGSGTAGAVDILRFSICITAGCGSETTINYIATMAAGAFTECAFNLAVAPSGSSGVIVDVQDASGTSIFDASKLVVPQNSTSVVYQTTFANSPQTIARGNKYKAVVLTNDSGGAAQGGTVQCR